MNESSENFGLLRGQAVGELARLGADGTRFQLVLAESCTGGLIAASMTGISGASKWFCGSTVVYQEPSKTAWLNISDELLDRYSAESAEVTAAMSRAILDVTPHANLSLATTGHLEPDPQREKSAPHVFVGISKRVGDVVESIEAIEVPLLGRSRVERQQEASFIAMRELLSFLRG